MPAKDGYRHLNQADKQRYCRETNPRQRLWQCSTCSTQVTEADRTQHAMREHGGRASFVRT